MGSDSESNEDDETADMEVTDLPRKLSKQLAAEKNDKNDEGNGTDDNEEEVGKGVLIRRRKTKTLSSNERSVFTLKSVKNFNSRRRRLRNRQDIFEIGVSDPDHRLTRRFCP